MKKNILIGRVDEIEILKSYQDSFKSEFVAVYGRRRVGKTFLVRRNTGISSKSRISESNKQIRKD